MDSQGLKSKLWETLAKKKDERYPWDTGETQSAPSRQGGVSGQRTAVPDSNPIEPEGSKVSGIARLKWLFFAMALIYVLVSAYRVPILTSMGQYLVVEQPPVKSDLIVCLAGGNVERGLAAADVYKRGLGSKIFVAREIIPDGYDILRRRGVSYPESRDLMVLMLKDLGVPESAILTTDTPSENTFMEAALVAKVVKENNFRSVILITSPTHSRRAWLVFKKAMEKDGVRILVVPSSYSKFKAEEWWKNRGYAKEVVLEYEKLVYYFFKGFI
jgi:uncharacterized SAM-binding protein YcdF (DUF218 family)